MHGGHSLSDLDGSPSRLRLDHVQCKRRLYRAQDLNESRLIAGSAICFAIGDGLRRDARHEDDAEPVDGGLGDVAGLHAAGEGGVCKDGAALAAHELAHLWVC